MRDKDLATIRRIALAVIIVATAIPVRGFRRPRFGGVRVYPLDILRNVLLYMPFGFGLGHVSAPVVIGRGAALSCLIEGVQLIYRGRSSNPMDVISNTTGSALGALLFRIIKRRIANAESAGY